MAYDAIVVGAGAAGLVSSAYLARSGRSVLLCERSSRAGGLVSSFWADGFLFDGGIRAFENSGIVFPMLRQLGIDMPVVNSPLSISIAGRTVRIEARSDLASYQVMLTELYPQEKQGISEICRRIDDVIDLMDVLYGIDNPLFIDIGKDKEYLMKTLLPWLVQYQVKIGKALRLKTPVNDYLRQFTQNESLIDIIAQHFFKNTPTFFALSYFGQYLDYSYPKGGTGRLVSLLEDFFAEHGGIIRLNADITCVQPDRRLIRDAQGQSFGYKSLVWAGDLKAFYRAVDTQGLKPALCSRVSKNKALLEPQRGGDSILSLYLAIDRDKAWFQARCGTHMFHTPDSAGQNRVRLAGDDKASILQWLKEYLSLTTYEISCPVLRDETLAPKGKTGLVVSVLLDYDLAAKIRRQGWYDEFKAVCKAEMIRVLDRSLLPGVSSKVIWSDVATPLTIEQKTGNSDGAITGWAFSQAMEPVENRFRKIRLAVRTPFRDVFQAGQWSFSPSGLPISILTGKMAADAANKVIGRGGNH